MRAALIFGLLTIVACEQRYPPVVSEDTRPATPPPAAPHGTAFQHPLNRFPITSSSDDPIRNPDVPPRLLKSKPPQYPPEARKQRIQGIVILEIVIETDGRVSAGRVLKPLPSGLTQSAIDSVRDWRYSPGSRRGRPVRVLQTVSVPFKLTD